MNSEFGSIQVVSEQMKNILHTIQQSKPTQKFIIVGDDGCVFYAREFIEVIAQIGQGGRYHDAPNIAIDAAPAMRILQIIDR